MNYKYVFIYFFKGIKSSVTESNYCIPLKEAAAIIKYLIFSCAEIDDPFEQNDVVRN